MHEKEVPGSSTGKFFMKTTWAEIRNSENRPELWLRSLAAGLGFPQRPLLLFTEAISI